MKLLFHKINKRDLFISTAVLFFSFTTSAQKNNEPLPIIDVHLHTFRIMPGAKFDYLNVYAPKTQDEYGKQVLALLNKLNIYAFVSGDDSVLQDWKTKNTKRIFPSKLVWSPKMIDTSLLKKELIEKKWLAIGEVLTQYQGLAPNDSSMEPIYRLAEEMDVPLGIHIGLGPAGGVYTMFPNFRASLNHPFLLEDVLIKHPKLRLYICHAGWPMTDEMLAMLYAFPQLYVDVAVIDWALPQKEFHHYLRRLVDAGFADRIMFGSDEMMWPEGIELSIKAIQDATFLTETQKRNIFYNNAVRFFKLNKEDVGGGK